MVGWNIVLQILLKRQKWLVVTGVILMNLVNQMEDYFIVLVVLVEV